MYFNYIPQGHRPSSLRIRSECMAVPKQIELSLLGFQHVGLQLTIYRALGTVSRFGLM